MPSTLQNKHPQARRIMNQGVTLIEVIITISLIAIVTATLTPIIASSLRDARFQSSQGMLDSDIQNSMYRLERDIRMAISFEQSIQPPQYIEPFGRDMSTSNTDPLRVTQTDSDIILVKSPSTAVGILNPGPIDMWVPAYVRVNPSSNCAAQAGTAGIFYHLSAYFVRDNTLYKRYVTDVDITNSSKSCSPSTSTQQSCPAGHWGSYARCTSNDEIIARDVESFSARFYRNQNPTPIGLVADPTVVTTADTVEVYLRLKRESAIGPVSSSMTLKMGMAR